MLRVLVASITVLGSLGIVLGAAPDAFARSGKTTPAVPPSAPSPPSPISRQARRAQRKADRKAAQARHSVSATLHAVVPCTPDPV
ncbi:hypothetical protein ABH944_003508 [Caballeronia udeis]|jgi:hypothetical protein|uniref:Uncharacterized protein n=1 Tax=Caballeronia udeis TaxID=1232866 RepID=A0ABW8MKR3_9BURK